MTLEIDIWSVTDENLLWGEPRSSLVPVLTELERFFLQYRVWFNQKMPRPVITIQTPSSRRRVLGWFVHKRWEQAQLGNLLPEINICPEHLSQDLFEVGHTMIHEMVHYANALVGIQDCNANQYHNSQFKQRAEEVGLSCGAERDPRIGWGFTQLTAVARERIAVIDLNERIFSLFRRSFQATARPGLQIPPKPKLVKWLCNCDSVWRAAGKRPMQALCDYCSTKYRLENP